MEALQQEGPPEYVDPTTVVTDLGTNGAPESVHLLYYNMNT